MTIELKGEKFQIDIFRDDEHNKYSGFKEAYRITIRDVNRKNTYLPQFNNGWFYGSKEKIAKLVKSRIYVYLESVNGFHGEIEL